MSFQNRRRVLLKESKLEINTVSKSSAWGSLVGGLTNIGPTLKWDIQLGLYNQVYYGNTPSIDLSNNTGIAEVKVTDVLGVKSIGLYEQKITSINISEMPLLETINLSGNLLTTLDVSKNTNLTFLEISLMPSIEAQSLDQIIIDLANHGKSNGDLYYNSGIRTTDSDNAKSTLQARGWNIVEWS